MGSLTATLFRPVGQGDSSISDAAAAMAASCRKAAQARLWSEFLKDPSLWKDNRNTKTNPRAPDFTHKHTNQPLWLDSRFSPSWVHDKLRLSNTEEPLLTAAYCNGHKIPCYMPINNSVLKETCQVLRSSSLHAMQIQDNVKTGPHQHVLQPCLDSLDYKQKALESSMHASYSHSNPSDDTLKVVAAPFLSNPGIFSSTLFSDKLVNHQRKFLHDTDLDSHSKGSNLSFVNLGNLLHKCRKEKDSAYALQHCMHEYGLDAENELVESLILAFVDAGCMNPAQQLFDRLESQRASVWGALITGYAKCREPHEALNLYQKMQDKASINLTAPVSLALLKACTELKDINTGEDIHAKLDKEVVEKDVYVGSSLIHMYAKCGDLAKAQEVFDNLRVQNVVTWNALISGYAEHGCSDEALGWHKHMARNGISPDGVTLVCSLKACGNKGDAGRVREIHAEILKKGLLEGDIILGGSLVDTYAKCGSLVEAQEVFDKLPARNIVSWNALINRFTEYGYSEKALNWFEQMQHDEITPDAATFISSLKACASMAAGSRAQEIHAYVVKLGIFDSDVFFGSIFVDVYAKCGWFTDMQYVFKSSSVRDAGLWNAFISALLEFGLYEEALKCFDQMQHEGVCSNAGTVISSLKICSRLGAPFTGWHIHIEMVKQGWLEQDAYVGSSLIDVYAKCGLCTEAQSVFEMLPARDVASWNALLAGYAEYTSGEEALRRYKLMEPEGISPDAITYSCVLKACTGIGVINEGRELHKEIVERGLENGEVANALIEMYSKCYSLGDAQHVFDHLPFSGVMSLNTLISGYIDCGCEEKVLHFYKHEHHKPVSADTITLGCSLKACGTLKATAEAQEIHSEAVCKGLEQDILVGNTLVDVYSRCGLFPEAHETFHKLETQDVVTWTALLAGYAEHGCGDEALYYFEKMLEKGISWDAVTLACILTVCGNPRAMRKGQALHVEAAKRGLLETHLSVGNALVDMYAKSGALEDSQKVFYSLPYRDNVSWNAFISGYVEFGCVEDAFGFFEQMGHDGITSDVSILICGLKACSSMVASDRGRELHSETVQKGLERELIMGNTLVDMYVKCGAFLAAQYAFDKLQARDLVSWNTLIAGYGQHGQSEDVFQTFEKMRAEDMLPDLVTFSCVLNACSHAGAVELGQIYFEAIVSDHGLIPTLEHHSCIVDLLGRAGQVDKAMAVISRMPCHPGIVAWHSTLGACQRWGNVGIGKLAFENVVALDDTDAAAYVCMCNIFVNANIHEQEIEILG
ncbi:hypothetical protein GOP47_0030402 [Adiantum capillus-veneris]|nr:hypothetical protein GOP47_0030402 [Adiantum capillus-veneris]